MKILSKSFACWLRPVRFVLTAVLLAVTGMQSEAAIYTVSSVANGITYSASYDSSLNGLTAWSANAANQLDLQSLYYSVNGGPVSQLMSPSVVLHGASSLTATYTVAGIVSAADTITLNGDTLGETIKFTNLSGTADTLSLFQYSDFVLGNAPGSQTLNLSVINGSQASANQSGGGVALQWLGQLTGGAVEVQASGSGAPFGPFLGGPPYALDNTTLSALGNAVFGYEFDAINLASGNSLTASETAALVVPEPSSTALVVLGMFAVAAFYRIRKGSVIAN